MQTKDWIVLAGFILAAQGAGLVGSLFTAPSVPLWYATLVRPALAPPNWVFGPVWTALFLLMGIAAFLVWRAGVRRRGVRAALGVFYVQLGLNVLWSILFFGLQSPGAALAEIMVLWIAILETIILFSKVSRFAAILLMPYLLWVTFATYLNYSFWVLNA